MGATLGRTFTDYRTLVETCRARADEMGLSRAEIDRLGGLPSGYAGKLLSKAAVDDVGFPQKKTTKKMWPVALSAMLGVLGLRIILVEDETATARTLALRVPVDHANQRFGVHHWRDESCLSARLLPPPSLPASPPAPVSRAHLRVVQSKRRAGKYG